MHFGLQTVKDLPGLEELKAAGLLDSDIASFEVSLGGQEDKVTLGEAGE